MQWLIGIYGFLAVLVRGLSLSLEGITIGGVIFLTVCLKRKEDALSLQASVRLLRWSAMLLAAVAAFGIALSAAVLHTSIEDLTWAGAVQTGYSLAGMVIAVTAIVIASLAGHSPAPALLAPVGVMLSAALASSHAFARVEDRPFLLLFTGLHHVGMAAWVGGLPYLLLTLARGGDEVALRVARRFSRLAMVSVAILGGAGLAMTPKYVDQVSGIYGTSYGAMLAAKAVLLGSLLLLGASNFRLLSRCRDALRRMKIRRVVEMEAAVGMVAILTAASLTSQPPAADLANGRVPLSEIVRRFTPRWPRLHSPPLSSQSPATPLNEVEAKAAGMPLPYVPGAAYKPDGPADIAWSEYNHNWAGICVLFLGVLAALGQSGRAPWARHWPLGFLGLALFVLIRSDSENWPLGPRGFWESFQVADVAQHRLFVLLVASFGYFEWQVATGRSARPWRALLFPAVCLMGGALLLTHTHPLGNVKEALLAELSHTGIALLAIAAGAARWLELRLPSRPSALRLVWPACLVSIGMLLTFYREG